MVSVGEMVLARVNKTIEDRLYTLQADILTGEYIGERAQIAYRGDPEIMVDKNVLAIGSVPGYTSLKVIDNALNFISSDQSQYTQGVDITNTILLGIWKTEWANREVPRISDIYPVYPIGGYKDALIFLKEPKGLAPYRLLEKHPAEKMTHYRPGEYDSKKRRLQGPSSAINHHVKKIRGLEKEINAKRRIPIRFFRLVLIDDLIPEKDVIVSAVKNIIAKDKNEPAEKQTGIEYFAWMEPQLKN